MDKDVNGKGTIVPITIEKEMRTSYMDYAMSVIVGRALPSVQDGLKPVHRRVLYSMHEQGNHHNRPYRKSARMVGDVIGKYHPHGESAVYDAIVRMAQSFSMRHPLVDGQGNFGSVDGDSPAAMRYTEIRMTELAHEMMRDIEKNTTDTQTNYDDSLTEPVLMPARIPNLMVNGTTGIAVGMASNIPPHNLAECLNAFLYYIDNQSQPNLEEMMALMPGPDFPTGGIIIGKKGIRDAYQTGRGSISVRGVVSVEADARGREKIVITELPFMVNKARLVTRIAELVREKKLEGISDLRDESDRTGMRVVVELKTDAIADIVINHLYKMTQLQDSFGIIMLAVLNNQPRLLSLADFFRYFLRHRVEVIERRTRFDLAKAEARLHILEGLRIALAQLDKVVALIRSSASPVLARESLIADFALSDIQAREILDMRLARLTALEQDKIQAEHTEITNKIAEYRAILSDREKVLDIVRAESTAIRDQYQEPRRTQLAEAVDAIDEMDLIANEAMVITISHAGYIKRSPTTLYRQQHRGGKGKIGITTKEEDFVSNMFVASSHDDLLFFTSEGRCFSKKVYEIPAASRTARGKAVVNLLPLGEKETVQAYLNVPEYTEDQYVMMITAAGTIKKTPLKLFEKIRKSGIRAISFNEGDHLQEVIQTSGNQQIALVTEGGLALRFDEKDIRPMGRTARGVRGIRLRPGDKVIAMEAIEGEGSLLAITENGYGKKTILTNYPIRKRGTQGVITIRVSKRNGKVIGALQVSDKQEVMIITLAGKLLRIGADNLRNMGRNTQGVCLIQLDLQDKAVSVARIISDDADIEDLPTPVSTEQTLLF